MELLTLWVALTISGGTATLDVGGSVAIDAPMIRWTQRENGWRYYAMAVGPLVLIDPLTPDRAHWLAHEIEHVQQWEALGPAFPIAYLLAPTEFEDYLGDETIWKPEPGDGLPRCPVIRLTNNSASLFPCFRF